MEGKARKNKFNTIHTLLQRLKKYRRPFPNSAGCIAGHAPTTVCEIQASNLVLIALMTS
jgi:hypothetical protein